MSLHDQLDEPGGAGAAKPTSAPAVDPLLERLLASEARKAREAQTAARRPPRSAGSPPAPNAPAPQPEPGAATSVVPDRALTNLPVALARGLSEQIPMEPIWDRAPLGSTSAELFVRLRAGKIVEHRIRSSSSPELERSLVAAFFRLERRLFSGGEAHAPDAALELRVLLTLRELAPGTFPNTPPFIQHRTSASGEYLPRARVVLPSLRQIEIEVVKRSEARLPNSAR